MADVQLTQQDIDYIARVVETEVPGYLAYSNPAEYERMVQGVVDTITNRIESDRFPNSVTGVANQNRQFSKITGPERLNPYGSVQRAPQASPRAQAAVYDYVAARAQGAPPTVGGALNYANPNFSDRRNLTGWIQPMIERGATALGIGRNVHQHGTVPGLDPVGFYTIGAEGMPSRGIPTPTPRGGGLPSQYGIMAAIDPPTVTPVERGLLGPVTQSAPITPGPVEYGGLLGPPSIPGAMPTAEVAKSGRVGSAPEFDMGRFGPARSAVPETPVAAFAPANFDMERFGPQIQTPTAPSSVLDRMGTVQPVAQGMEGLQRALLDQQLAMGILPSIPSPIDPAKTAAVPGYRDPMVAAQPQFKAPVIEEVPQPPPVPQVAGPASVQPQISAPVTTRPAQQALSARPATPAPSLLGPQIDVQRQMNNRSMLGGIGGALLGGALLGPIGGLLGGMVGRNVAQRTYFPPAPAPVSSNSFPDAPAKMSEAEARDFASRYGGSQSDIAAAQSWAESNPVAASSPGLF